RNRQPSWHRGDTPMSPAAKRLLNIYLVTYAAVSILINVTLGPPRMSDPFLERYKGDYDRYLAITKNEACQRWKERPELIAPDGALRDNIAFVERFEALPEFVAEEERRAWYDLSADLFRFAIVLVLLVY